MLVVSLWKLALLLLPWRVRRHRAAVWLFDRKPVHNLLLYRMRMHSVRLVKCHHHRHWWKHSMLPVLAVPILGCIHAFILHDLQVVTAHGFVAAVDDEGKVRLECQK